MALEKAMGSIVLEKVPGRQAIFGKDPYIFWKGQNSALQVLEKTPSEECLCPKKVPMLLQKNNDRILKSS